MHNVCIISKLFFVIQFLVFPCPLLSSSFSSSESVSYSTIKTLNVLFFTAIFVSKGISKLQPKKKTMIIYKCCKFQHKRNQQVGSTLQMVQHVGLVCRDLNIFITIWGIKSPNTVRYYTTRQNKYNNSSAINDGNFLELHKKCSSMKSSQNSKKKRPVTVTN